MYDYVINNGLIVDGTRGKPYRAQVCIQDGLIAAINTGAPAEGKKSLDATGRVVAPGFIDIHAHSDPTRLISPLAESKVYQGVTLELSGNCGISVVPTPADPKQHEDILAEMASTISIDKSLWDSGARDIKEFAQRIDGDKNTIHMGMLVGHGAIRGCVVGFERRNPSPGEMDAMKDLLDRMLTQGAFGLSLGLIYSPGVFCETEELIELAKVVKKHDGLLTVHMRDEGVKIFEALDEMFRVARESGVHLHISHLKLLHHAQWGRAEELLGKIRAAQAEGLFITADQYPYDASSTTLSSLLPGWVYDGGSTALVARLKDPAQRKRIDPEIESKMDGRGGPTCIRIATTQNVFPELEELTVTQIAEKWGLSPVDTVARLLVECDGSVGIISHSISPKDMLRIMKEMDIAICSDGSAFTLDPAHVPGKPHRRHYGTFPQFLQLVRENQLMPIEDAVYKITGFPAKTMGLLDRGILKQGYAADITLFDPAKVQDLTTYGNPFVKPRGIDYVFVSGEPVVYQGELTKARNGKFIFSTKK